MEYQTTTDNFYLYFKVESRVQAKERDMWEPLFFGLLFLVVAIVFDRSVTGHWVWYQ